jgi:diguanylate cyclase (GGDEF)-like protein/PAS domain S-box-containing protein
MWRRFVTNNFRFASDDLRFRRVYMINVSILLFSGVLLFFAIYNTVVTAYYDLASIEFAIALIYMALLYYFHRTSDIKTAAYGVLVLLFSILAAVAVIIEHREYALYWLIIFLPVSIFLLGYKKGLQVNAVFVVFFAFYMLWMLGGWEPAPFELTSILNILSALTVLAVIIAYFDLSREEADRALERQDRLLQEEHAMVDRYVIVCTVNPDGELTYASEAFCRLAGYSEAELLGQSYSTICQEDITRNRLGPIRSAIDTWKVWQGEIAIRNKSGKHSVIDMVIAPVYDSDGKATGYRAIGEDITDKKHIGELAVTDYLTRLYNRVKLDQELLKEIRRAERYKTPLCVTLLDIDHFKDVNDTYGHQTGDAVLKAIAAVLKQNSREVDIAGRWGGEEFLIITPSTPLEQGRQFAEKLRRAIASHPAGASVRVTASFGVAEYRDGDTLERLTERVDRALYRAKDLGRNRVERAVESTADA